VFADADGSFTGTDLPAVAGPVLAGEADLVVGSRMARRAPGAMSALAALENRLLGLGCRLLFGVPPSDLGPFQAIRREMLLALGVTDRGSGRPREMVGRAGRLGLQVVEVSVRYRARAGGRSKVSGSLPGSRARRPTGVIAGPTSRPRHGARPSGVPPRGLCWRVHTGDGAGRSLVRRETQLPPLSRRSGRRRSHTGGRRSLYQPIART
jgi:hypothetical protein